MGVPVTLEGEQVLEPAQLAEILAAVTISVNIVQVVRRCKA
jgi:hypothetical protein